MLLNIGYENKTQMFLLYFIWNLRGMPSMGKKKLCNFCILPCWDVLIVEHAISPLAKLGYFFTQIPWLKKSNELLTKELISV